MLPEDPTSSSSGSGEPGDTTTVEIHEAPTDEGAGALSSPVDPQAIGGDRMRRAVAASGGGYSACFLPTDGIPRCKGHALEAPLPVAVDRVRSILGSGSDKYVAVRSDGTLWRWTRTGPGEDPEIEQIETEARFRTVTWTGARMCGVRTDGRLMCTHGPDTPTSTLVPFPELTAVVGVEVGVQMGCAVRAAGDVWCWGNNDLGQLGVDGIDESDEPIRVEGISGAVAIAVSRYSVCALLEGGGVSCWGSNQEGALGTGNALPEWTSSPVAVANISDAVSLVANVLTQGTRQAFCVVRANGTVSCWGDDFGVPAQRPNLAGVAQISVTHDLSIIALLADGTAVQTGTAGDPTITPIPGFDSGLVTPRIAAGKHHTCALRSNGTVACWGDNAQGELGDGTTVVRSTAVDVVGLTGAIDIASSLSHTCAVMQGGGAKCWGRNNSAELGDGGAAFPYATTPVDVADLGDIVAISPGSGSTCALRESGQVYCWGMNDHGQLGDGTFVDRSTPAPVTGLVDAIAISTGGKQYCAIRANGDTRCWGMGSTHQLGNGSDQDRTTPVTVKINALQSLSDTLAIAGDNAASCAVRANGVAYCWGSDLHGLGNGAAGFSQVYAQAVSGITSALDVAMGSSAQCVLLATGTVRCFGTNQYGELGDATAPLGVDQYTPRTVGSLFAPLTGVLAIDSGDDHSCAMLVTGAVKCWGMNSRGQLGDGTLTHRSSPVTVVDFP